MKRAGTEFQADNMTGWAAALTYYGLLSLFPALIDRVDHLQSICRRAAADRRPGHRPVVGVGLHRRVHARVQRDLGDPRGESGSVGLITLLVWFWISNLALLFGMELNAERERGREFAVGVPRADKEIQLEPREEPNDRKTV